MLHRRSHHHELANRQSLIYHLLSLSFKERSCKPQLCNFPVFWWARPDWRAWTGREIGAGGTGRARGVVTLPLATARLAPLKMSSFSHFYIIGLGVCLIISFWRWGDQDCLTAHNIVVDGPSSTHSAFSLLPMSQVISPGFNNVKVGVPCF